MIQIRENINDVAEFNLLYDSVGWLLGENLDECRDFGMGSVPRLVWEAGSRVGVRGGQKEAFRGESLGTLA